MEFTQEEIMVKILLPRNLGFMFRHENVMPVNENLFLLDIENTVMDGVGSEVRMFVFPFNGEFSGTCSNVNFDRDDLATEEVAFDCPYGGLKLTVGEGGKAEMRFESAFGDWIIGNNSPVYGPHYDHAVLGTKRAVDFTCKSGATFGGLDFWASKLGEQFHFLALKRDVKGASLLPSVEAIGTKAHESKDQTLEKIIKYLQGMNLGADVTTKVVIPLGRMAGLLFLGLTISKDALSKIDGMQAIDEIVPTLLHDGQMSDANEVRQLE